MITQSHHLPNDGGTSYGPYDGLNIAHKKLENLGAQGRRNVTTIGILSDNVLLEIFDCYRKSGDLSPFCVWKWHLLVHVCQRWRQLIFASPRRLDLQLLCTYVTPSRKIMDIWPTIPIILLLCIVIRPSEEDNVTAALENPDRVSRIRLFVNESQLGKIATSMQKPFPVLTHLSISSRFGKVSALPDGFLGGSAPSLQQLHLYNVLYPALPTLLFSAGNLVNLSLRNIPPTGYISPEALVSHVAASPKLETLYIKFDDLTPFPDLILSSPLPRTVLPALRNFSFFSECKYLEDFISRIDTPQLNFVFVYYQSGDTNINFDVPQLSKFINRSENLKRSLSRHCKIMVDQDQDNVTLCVGRTTSERRNPKPGILVCLGVGIKEQISHLTNILGFMSPILSDVLHCTIDSVQFMLESPSESEPEGRGDFDWLQLLRQLSSLQTLFVSDNVAGLISRALAYVNVGTMTEVLPALQLLCLEESEESEEDQPTRFVHKFLAVRQESDHPVAFVKTKEEFEEKFKSYQ